MKSFGRRIYSSDAAVFVVGSARFLAIVATFSLGVVLPIALTPASKSSPLMLALSAVLTLGAVILARKGGTLLSSLRDAARSSGSWLACGLIGLMVASLLWAHNPASSANQLLQFLVPLITGALLCVAFPLIAPRDRITWWVLGAAAAGLIVAIDIYSGLKLREATGGLKYSYSYNRALVTLVVLIWPLLALVAARGKPFLAIPLLAVAAGVFAGQSQTAVLGLVAGLVVFPIAWFLPRMTRWIGVAAILVVIGAAPFFGTLSSKLIGPNLHKTLEDGHSFERVQIWLSYEAAAQKRLLLGNGFGSAFNLQQAPVAREVSPEHFPRLADNHPHNAFLQLWTELGAVGAALVAALFIFLFRTIGQMPTLLQPFMLTWVAVASAIALVSHGAWQAWWVAALAASAAGFLTVAREMREDEQRDGTAL